MIYFYAVLFLILLLIGIIDYATSEIPNALNLALGVLGLAYYLINIKTNWWLPLILSFGSFTLLFIFFLITGEALIGGGDMKMIMASMLFIHSFSSVYNYLLWFSAFALIGVILTYLKGERGVRCGPYLGLALLYTLTAKYMTLTDGFYILAIFIISVIGLSYTYLMIKKEVFFDEEINKLF